MKYKYNINTGITKIKTNTRKYVSGAISALAIAGAVAVPAFAAKPATPGCFGADRAAYIQNIAQTDASAPGASEVGKILAGRGGDNGTINQTYKTTCGGDPTTP
jgi:hypothetical protein